MKTFFTSDLHLYYYNIIKHSLIPFNNIEEMNNTFIQNWNNVVKEDDIIYILGDLGIWYGDDKDKVLNTYKNKLKGRKILILGNHDSHYDLKELEDVFESIHTRLEIKIDNQLIVLDHYPMISWNDSFRDLGNYLVMYILIKFKILKNLIKISP